MENSYGNLTVELLLGLLHFLYHGTFSESRQFIETYSFGGKPQMRRAMRKVKIK